MYYVDLTKFENLLQRYNITASRAVKLNRENKVEYYTGFKTLKLPVINSNLQEVKEYQLSTIVNGLRNGRKIYPLLFDRCLTFIDSSTVTLILMTILRKGISYSDYFVFLHRDTEELCFVYKNDLYVYPMKLSNVKSLHMEKDFLQLNNLGCYSNITMDLSLNLKEDVFNEENFFATDVENIRDTKKLSDLITIKRTLMNGLT